MSALSQQGPAGGHSAFHYDATFGLCPLSPNNGHSGRRTGAFVWKPIGYFIEVLFVREAIANIVEVQRDGATLAVSSLNSLVHGDSFERVIVDRQ